MIGSLGDVEFSVSESQVKTFRDLKFSHQAKFSEHAIIGRKSLLEFTGISPSTVSMTITLDQQLGSMPEMDERVLRDYLDQHKAIPFVLNGLVQGAGLWVIESLNSEYLRVSHKGICMAMNCTLTLKEYIQS